MKGWYGDRYAHGLASKGIRLKNIRACGNKKEHSVLFDPEVIKLTNEINNLRDDILEDNVELDTKILELSRLLGINPYDWRNEEFGEHIFDSMRTWTGEHPYEIMMNYYNLAYPFKKFDNVWDRDLQTWVHITRINPDETYEGKYHDQYGNYKDVTVSYRTLRRQEHD